MICGPALCPGIEASAVPWARRRPPPCSRRMPSDRSKDPADLESANNLLNAQDYKFSSVPPESPLELHPLSELSTGAVHHRSEIPAHRRRCRKGYDAESPTCQVQRSFALRRRAVDTRASNAIRWAASSSLAHCDSERIAYPTPRIVWINFARPPPSTLFRSKRMKASSVLSSISLS